MTDEYENREQPNNFGKQRLNLILHYINKNKEFWFNQFLNIKL